MKILKLPSYCYPEQLSSSHITADIESLFSENEIQEVIYAPTPCRGLTPNQRKAFKKTKHEVRANGTVEVHRFAMFYEPNNTIIRALRYSLIHVVQYFYACKEHNVDLLTTGSTPPTQMLLFSRLRKTLSRKAGVQVPLIYVLQDVFPDSLVLAGLTKRGSLIWNIGRKIEDYSYRNADVIVVISEDIKNNIMEKGVPPKKIVLIPNWVNTDEVHPVKKENNALAHELGFDDNPFYIVYAGNLGKAQSVDTILDAAKITGSRADIKYLIFGQGSCSDKLKERVIDERLCNVRILPYQPHSRVSEVYSMGDICLVTCRKGAGAGAFPSKTVSILATATPIIASFDEDSELCKLITEVNCGYCTEPDDPKALAEAIIKAYNDKSTLAQMGMNGRVYIENNRSKAVCASKYIELYKKTVAL